MAEQGKMEQTVFDFIRKGPDEVCTDMSMRGLVKVL